MSQHTNKDIWLSRASYRCYAVDLLLTLSTCSHENERALLYSPLLHPTPRNSKLQPTARSAAAKGSQLATRRVWKLLQNMQRRAKSLERPQSERLMGQQ